MSPPFDLYIENLNCYEVSMEDYFQAITWL